MFIYRIIADGLIPFSSLPYVTCFDVTIFKDVNDLILLFIYMTTIYNLLSETSAFWLKENTFKLQNVIYIYRCRQ